MAFGIYQRLTGGVSPTKLPPLVAPGNVPVTLRKFPDDFKKYQYVGPVTDMVTSRGLDGTLTPRACLMARMVLKINSPGGASSELDANFSVNDLTKGEHPQAREIAASLRSYYETKVHGVPGAAAPSQPTPSNRRDLHSAGTEKIRTPVTKPVTTQQQPAAMSLFAMLNSPGT